MNAGSAERTIICGQKDSPQREELSILAAKGKHEPNEDILISLHTIPAVTSVCVRAMEPKVVSPARPALKMNQSAGLTRRKDERDENR